MMKKQVLILLLCFSNLILFTARAQAQIYTYNSVAGTDAEGGSYELKGIYECKIDMVSKEVKITYQFKGRKPNSIPMKFRNKRDSIINKKKYLILNATSIDSELGDNPLLVISKEDMLIYDNNFPKNPYLEQTFLNDVKQTETPSAPLKSNSNKGVHGTLYKADRWANIKGKGDWAKAMDNPTIEKVEILKTSEAIKVTFGTKVYNYIIVSENKFSEVKMDYSVTLNGKGCTLSILDYSKSAIANLRNKGTYSVNIEGVWMVSDIKDVSILK